MILLVIVIRNFYVMIIIIIKTAIIIIYATNNESPAPLQIVIFESWIIKLIHQNVIEARQDTSYQ